MEANMINLEEAGDMDRKYLLAFLKGLCQIKYRDFYAKLRQREGDEADESMDLEFLYSNLFNQDQTSAETFN